MSGTKRGEYSKQNRSYADRMNPGQANTFIENTYAKLLKKAGKTIKKTHFDAKAEFDRLIKQRPEYTGTFAQKQPRYQYES